MWLADGDAGKIDAANAALTAAVGAARAAQLIADYAPFNLARRARRALDQGDGGAFGRVRCLPSRPATTQHSWSQAPQVRQFPDRFVVLGFNGSAQTLEAVGGPVTLPLYTGPDPSADPNTDPTSCIHPDGPDLFVPDQLQWMVDFDRAVAAGMALAIPLTARAVRSGIHAPAGRWDCNSALLPNDGPRRCRSCLPTINGAAAASSLVAQGTPTHNASRHQRPAPRPKTTRMRASTTARTARCLRPSADPTQKRDGQWLAEFLGLDPTFVAGVHGSGGVDQMQARAMQTALWPATLGYWMDTLFTPNPGTTSIFSDAVIEDTRSFFTPYVSGRGPLPAIRIGGQPYGILPVTAFSRIQWFRETTVRAGSALSPRISLACTTCCGSSTPTGRR